MKSRRIKLIIGFFIILIGLVLLNYPYLSGLLNDVFAYKEVQGYEMEVKEMDTSERDAKISTARLYNEALAGNGNPESFKDFSLLQDGAVIGTVDIPQINAKLAVRYGTTNEVLDKGLGLIENSSIPIGGPSTHAVISGHSGMASMKALTNLTSVKIGDVFFVHTLDIDMAYKVDQILVVEPWDNSALAIEPEKDYVTLLTCTPYGVNSHRLLVRGVRIEYDFSVPVIEQEVQVEERLSTVELTRRIIFYVSCVVLAIMVIALIVGMIVPPKKKKKKKAAANPKPLKELNEGGLKDDEINKKESSE